MARKWMYATMAALGWLAGSALAATDTGGSLAVWAVDPHVKVFRDTQAPKAAESVTLRAASNEYESGQVAIRSGLPLKGVRVELSPLRLADGTGTIGLDHFTASFVGFIPVKKNTHDSEAVWIRRAPCEIPDVLLESQTLDVQADSTQPVWLTVFVPKDATPGVYRGEVTVVAGERRAAVPVTLTVDPFTLPDERHLYVTNWFSLQNIIKAHKTGAFNDAFWKMLDRYARLMAAHRQNVARVEWNVIDVDQQTDGSLTFSYRHFDDLVEIYQRAGMADRLEIAHVGGAKNGWGTEVALASVTATDKKTGKLIDLGPEQGLKPLLVDLERHLDQRGWLSKSMIHVSDEPMLKNLASWRKASDFVHQAAPRLRRIDAIETIDFAGALEVWVPKLSHFDHWRQAFEARRADGEFWYYICCDPCGNLYPNRFLDFPLSRVRVLHWINFTERLPGYLHWGLNYWGEDPFGTPDESLPPGDTHVIYPGASGPLSSIRWEIERESIEDYEYLWLLCAKTEEVKKRLGPAAAWLDPRRRAEELARQVVPAIADCEKDPAKILAIRGAIADEIIALDRQPLLIVQTEPPDGSTLAEGPVWLEVWGITEPGASVKVNATPVAVSDDGTFRSRAGRQVVVEAEHNGKKQTTTTRHFVLRK
jgi:hypothetical protein